MLGNGDQEFRIQEENLKTNYQHYKLVKIQIF